MEITLQHHFLIAMPEIQNKMFQKTVIYICEHNQYGAMGIIINQTIKDFTIKNILKKLHINTSACLFGPKIHDPVIMGGFQAEDRGFILHSSNQQFASSVKIADDMFMTTSRDILESIGILEEPYNILIALGYCIWGKNQLEQELLENYWLITSANHQILFNTPIEDRWIQSAKIIGIDMNKLSIDVEHI